MASTTRIVLGIDPGLANTGWGIIKQEGSRLSCVAYGCISTSKNDALPMRLEKIHDQMVAVVQRFEPTCVGVETVLFGQNTQSAFATGQARGAALVACARAGLNFAEFPPARIKQAVVGSGDASKKQVQYMVARILGLDAEPSPDHAADALAAAITYTAYEVAHNQGRM